MSAKILVVDDEPDMELLIKQHFRRIAQENRFEFTFAQNGVQALQEIRGDNSLDVLMTDLNMPEMDGLALLSEVAQKHPLLKSIVVSAYGDMGNIRAALNRGAFDFVTKPIDFQDLKVTLQKALRAARSVRAAAKDREQLVAIRRELGIARAIQTSILPSISLLADRPEVDIFTQMIPAREVGGDFYDFFLIDPAHLGFAIGDVSGKGVPAALFMALSRTLLKITAIDGMLPHECLREVNQLLASESTSGMFFTIFYGVLNTSTGVVQYSNGGHNLPYLVRANGKIERLSPTEGTIMGPIANLEFDCKDVQMNPQDLLLLFTDGITEARQPNGHFFGTAGLEQALTKTVNGGSLRDLVEHVIARAKAFMVNGDPQDDLTVLALQYRKH